MRAAAWLGLAAITLLVDAPRWIASQGRRLAMVCSGGLADRAFSELEDLFSAYIDQLREWLQAKRDA